MPTPQQIEATRYHLGGSTIGWALGYGTRAPSELWEVKVKGRPVVVSDEMWFGTVVEDATRALAERYLRKSLNLGVLVLQSCRETMYHAEHGTWWAVHPDAMASRHRLFVQLKCHNPRVFTRYYQKPSEHDDNDKVPVNFVMQVLWERAVLESHDKNSHWTGYLGAYFGGTDLKLYRIGRDTRLLDAMIRQGFAWWKQHLDPNGPQSQPDDRFWMKRMAAARAPAQVPPPFSRPTKEEIASQPVIDLASLA